MISLPLLNGHLFHLNAVAIFKSEIHPKFHHGSTQFLVGGNAINSTSVYFFNGSYKLLLSCPVGSFSGQEVPVGSVITTSS